ncbi:hypothetical protein BH11PSE11_BH11PSE11_33210 [soil metagenome]
MRLEPRLVEPALWPEAPGILLEPDEPDPLEPDPDEPLDAGAGTQSTALDTEPELPRVEPAVALELPVLPFNEAEPAVRAVLCVALVSLDVDPVAPPAVLLLVVVPLVSPALDPLLPRFM